MKRKNKNQLSKPMIEILFHLYKHDMFRVANSILKDEDKAEDAVQNAFLKLLKNRGEVNFEPDSLKAKHYCIVAVRSAALDMYRKEKRIIEEPMDETVISVEDSLDVYLKKESYESLCSKIGKLKEIYRVTLVLRHFHELDFRTIGDITGVSEATARKRYQIARNRLAEMIRKEDDFFEQ